MQFDAVKSRHCGLLLALSAAILSAGYLTPCSAQERSQFEIGLGKMRYVDRPQSKDLPELEARCLKLIEDHNSPPEKGKIYATIACIYSDAGFTSSADPRPTKTVAYAKKALEHPLDVLTACDMYAHWADAVAVLSRKYEEARLAQTRREAAATCLKGLKLALDHDAPAALQPVPAVPRLHMGRESPMYKQMMKEHQKQQAAADKAILENELYLRRWTLTQILIGFYSRAPYDVGEFRGEAQKVLAGKDEVVAEMAAEMEERVAFDKRIHSQDPNLVMRR